MNKELTRHQVREKAVQTLFQFVHPQIPVNIQEAIEFALEAGNDPEAGYEIDYAQTYLEEVVSGVITHQAEIDQTISQYLSEEWTLERIAKIDMAILRLAFYEILYVDQAQVPRKVAVNEAIELAKTYSDEKSRLFINGVLHQLLIALQ